MKFLLHSWLRPDGICSVYIYYDTPYNQNPSEKATLRPSRRFRQQNSLHMWVTNYGKKRRRLKHCLRVVGRPGYAIWLFVSEGEKFRMSAVFAAAMSRNKINRCCNVNITLDLT